MAFTYNLNSSDPTLLLISRLRLEINDKVQGQGVLPNGANFSDEELLELLTRGGSNVERAAALAYGVLASAWAAFADVAVGPRREALSQVSNHYMKLAQMYRTLTGSDAVTVSVGMKRADGYELSNPSKEY